MHFGWLDYLIIKKSGYFDPAYYLLSYPDCRLADVDPLWHFIEHGWKEHRNPSLKFDTGYYLRANPDVLQAGINPLVHYLQYGQHEGRLPAPGKLPPLSQSLAKGKWKDGYLSVFYKVGKKVYWLIPAKYRQKVLLWFYHYVGGLFKGTPHYDNFQLNQAYIQTTTAYNHNLIDINRVLAAPSSGGSIAIHLHIFYHDLVNEFIDYLNNVPYQFDLYVSVSNDQDLDTYQRLFSNLPQCDTVSVKRVFNRGRDIAPMICTFGEKLATYDYIAHLHTKKSLYNDGATQGWREYLCTSLFGSEERVRRIFTLMHGEQPFGIVYPQNYIFLPSWANTWLANAELGRVWCARLGIHDIPQGYFDYPASSMFWARGDALTPLFHAGITLEDFPEETGQTDGTLAHCIERLFVICSDKQGMPPAIIQDEIHPSWSAWRFDQYTGRQYQDTIQHLNSLDAQLIAFDFFDTLFCRPLLHPESVKAIVSRRVGSEVGHLYKEYRAIAEQQARSAAGLDVGLDQIYVRLGELTGLAENNLQELRRAEEQIEAELLEPRLDTVNLYRTILGTGKPVAIITDTFLPQEFLRKNLKEAGITEYDTLFVSNAVGLRKDRGDLYKHVLAHYAIQPSEMLMIGDHERSDIQIPCDMGALFFHLLRPVELARGLPRFSSLIDHHERRADLDAELTLGLVVRKNFSPIFYQEFDPESLIRATPYNWGYSLVGPLLVSFANWLLLKSRSDGIDRFYFLSREGKIIKQVFDLWCEEEQNPPQTKYLILSRRAAGVAAISELADIFDIAKTTYFPNTLDSFLYTRYGLRLSDEKWNLLSKSQGFNRSTIVSVQNRRIDHLIPLLQDIEDEIIAKVNSERITLLRYLTDQGLNLNDMQAVVDIGYGGSVQGYINKLIHQKVHGYYLITDERSLKIVDTYDVLIRGCFFENIKQSSESPLMYKLSFNLEKLLSVSEPQIEFYSINPDGKSEGHYRELSIEELNSIEIREQLLEGAMDYTKDVRRIRQKILHDFQPSCWTAQMLMDAFLIRQSQSEAHLLSMIVLDDHYCGRDLVS
jgi:FMN phosphatase YigB (HAD superfamily)